MSMLNVLTDADVHALRVLRRLEREQQPVRYAAYLTLMRRAGYALTDSNLAFERSGCSVKPNQTINFLGLREA